MSLVPRQPGAARAGQRVFDVAINGTLVLDNYDVFATAGAAHRANVQTFTATADGTGQVALGLTSVTNSALINGIELF